MTDKDHYTTIEAARILGLAVRSVQLMVDRGELEAWKTPGGHRRIPRESVQRWRASRQTTGAAPLTAQAPDVLQNPGETNVTPLHAAAVRPVGGGKAVALLIEDSTHYQNLIRLVVQQKFPNLQLVIANDGLAGLALFGKLEPAVLLVDILLPGIDGATLITTLRSHPQFRNSRLIVVTSLDANQRKPYAFALEGVPLVEKAQLVQQLPPLIESALAGGTPNA